MGDNWLGFTSLKTQFIEVEPDPVPAKIASFLSLSPGWNFGEGVPATSAAALGAYNVAIWLRHMGFTAIDASPALNGSVTISAIHGDTEVEITARDRESTTLLEARHDQESTISDELGTDALLARLNEITGSCVGLGGSITNAIISQTYGDLVVMHSPTSMVVFQYSTSNASETPILESANTFSTTTPAQPA